MQKARLERPWLREDDIVAEDPREMEGQMTEFELVVPRVDPAKTLAKGRHPLERAFAVADRYAAYLSAILLFLFMLSGFGMTKADFVNRATSGLITWRVSYDMHNLLDIPLMVAFTFHTFTGIRRALLRKTKRRRRTAWIAAGLGAIVLGFMLMLVLAPTGF
jgi:cytochrome b subunit of formate dehydrogenase